VIANLSHRPMQAMVPGIEYGRELRFTDFGQPKVQGNHRISRKGKVYDASGPALGAWRGTVAKEAALAAGPGWDLMSGPVELVVVFYRPRPKSWPKRRRHITTSPDVSKLLRAVEDALSGIVYVDDAQIVCDLPLKLPGTPQRAEFVVREIVE